LESYLQKGLREANYLPSRKWHLDKCDNNLKAYIFLRDNTPNFLDWKVVMLFYAALHDVDAFLDLLTIPHYLKHPKRHEVRNKLVARHLSQVAYEYVGLYHFSKWARYKESPVITQDYVDLSFSLFSAMHSFLTLP